VVSVTELSAAAEAVNTSRRAARLAANPRASQPVDV
jgi:hypothetical protein